VSEGCLQLRIGLELLLGDAEELTHVDRLAGVAIDDAEEALCRNAVILGRVVPLPLVFFHLSLQVSQLFLRRLPIRAASVTPTTRIGRASRQLSEKFFHLIFGISL